ncbi:MAG TPA: HD domain-containing phosphohydrolase [Candidatus Dormibacteraeota bacterium]
MTGAPQATSLRLAEPLASLSLMTDLARGQPSGQSLRACLLATRLASLAGLSAGESSDVYYSTLLRFVGCTAPSSEYAATFGGDDVDVRGRGELVDEADPGQMLPFILSLGRSSGALSRARVVTGALARGRAVRRAGIVADCEVASMMAARLSLGSTVADALAQHFERWDGKGGPAGLKGEAISLAARFGAVATAAVIFADVYSPEDAVSAVDRWSGRLLDPLVAGMFVSAAAELRAAEPPDAWPAVLEAEPTPSRRISETRLDDVLAVFGEVADLKSAYLHGHSSGVAALAAEGARHLGLPDADVGRVRRAGLVHDIGRVLVPTGIWDKPGALTTAEWELVRLHPYHSERILGSSDRLRELARLAGMHHERLNGYGYHRGAAAGEQSLSARVLAAADVYQALTEARPHRAAHAPAEAARMAAAEALDREAFEAVLEAAGQREHAPRRAWPAGLTDREVEVLRPLVRGQSMADIGRQLHISTSTVHTHVAHIYEKTGVSTRAAAAMFAMEQGLLR